MREYFRLVRIDCDGCGLAVLECMEGGVEGALQECGWVSRERNGSRQDLCPTCRPDSPFEAVKRVRKVCAEDSFFLNHANGGSGRGLTVAQVLAALEGDSDEPAGP